jgi:hypothetical protein
LDLFGVCSVPYLCRRNYYFEFKHLIPWGLMAGMIEGNVGAIVVAKTFDGGEFLVATANATPIGALLFSSIWGVLCIGRPKLRLATIFGALTALMTATICLTPHTRFGGYLFVAQMAAAQVFLSGVVTVRSALWKHNYPPEARGMIAARLQAVRLIVGVGVLILVMLYFDRDPSAYRYVYPAVAASGCLALTVLQRIHVRHEKGDLRAFRDGTDGAGMRQVSVRQAISPGVQLKSFFGVLRENPRYAWYLTTQMALGVSVQLVMPVLVVVLNEVVASYLLMALLVQLLPRLLMFASIRRWGVLFDRVGVNRFRVFTGACAAAGLLMGLIGTVLIVRFAGQGPQPDGYVYAALGLFAFRGVLHGMHQGGGTLAWNLGHLHYAQRHNAEQYMAVHQTLTGVRGFFAPFLGMLLWQWIGWPVWAVALLTCLAALTGFHALARTDAPGHRPV